MEPVPESVRLLRVAGLAVWSMVGVHAAVQGAGKPESFALWLASLLTFGALFAWTTGRLTAPRRGLALGLALEAACVITATAVQCRGFEGTLLVLVAMQLGLVMTRAHGLGWVALQSVTITAAIAHHWSLRPALLLAPPYLGFQVLGFLVFELVGRETRTRLGLVRANADLVSTRTLLAESTRQNERLRIGRELHDVMGHHLAALSLNLQAVEPASPPLLTARALTRRLLDDVESVVATLGPERGLDLEQALRALADAIPQPRIHLDAADLALEEPERAHALLRCCQEIVTNSVRHAAASNLWISIQRRDGVFELDARDDGHGASRTDGGQGLPGLRRRLAEIGGTLHVETRPGAGFHLHARLPCEGPRAGATGPA